jgi:hypothetical protein
MAPDVCPAAGHFSVFNKWEAPLALPESEERKFMKKFAVFILAGGVSLAASNAARACACGCGVFDVGTSSMIPNMQGGMAFVEFDYQDQDQNWSNTGPAPAADNGDKHLETFFTTYGMQYMFNRKWGVQVEVPYDVRNFTTTGGATGNQLVSFKWGSFGDVRLEGLYTGFSDDMSSGLNFGVKLPTGNYTHNDAFNDIDRDSELGSGSTDLLLGGFHRHRLAPGFTWFAQGLLDVPVLTQDQYRPGVEFDGALGTYYKGWYTHGITITPLGQIIGSVRTSDIGDNASGGINDDPDAGRASGYQRILLSPGIDIKYRKWDLYADAEFPVFQDFVGNQLVAPFLFKTYLSYMF